MSTNLDVGYKIRLSCLLKMVTSVQMLKVVFFALLLMSSKFAFGGPILYNFGIDATTIKANGTFSGTDSNADNVFTQSEISSFSISVFTTAAVPGTPFNLQIPTASLNEFSFLVALEEIETIDISGYYTLPVTGLETGTYTLALTTTTINFTTSDGTQIELSDTVDSQVVYPAPAPSTLVLFSLGLVCFGINCRKRTTLG